MSTARRWSVPWAVATPCLVLALACSRDASPPTGPAERGLAAKLDADDEAQDHLSERSEELLARAARLQKRGVVLFRRGDLAAARRVLQRALELRQTAVPRGLPVAETLVSLAKIERNLSRSQEARELLRRALDILHDRAPRSPEMAAALVELGTIAYERGELAQAQELYRRALDLHERLGSRDQGVGAARMGLGNVAWARGDLAAAEEQFVSALEIFRRQAPGSQFEAWSLNNLGLLADDRGDLAGAESYYRRALRIRQRLTPRALDHAGSLINLGANAMARSDPAAARAAYEEALAIVREKAPESLYEAYVLGNLGKVAEVSGELDAAGELLHAAVALLERIAPRSLDHAEALEILAKVRQEQGRVAETETLLHRALAIRRRLAPDSAVLAESLYALATFERRRGRVEEARVHFELAARALEAQRGRLGGTEHYAAFGAAHGSIYLDLMTLLLERGLVADAFTVLERYRAQGLRALLAQRDLALARELPPRLRARRRALVRRYETTQAELRNLDAGAAHRAEIEGLLGRLRDLQRGRRRLMREIRDVAPRLAAVEEPQPVPPEALPEILEPGTLVLSYAVGSGGSWVFVADRSTAIDVHRLEVTADELRERVRRFLLLARTTGPAGAGRDALSRRGADLYRLLLAPVEPRLVGAKRLLIVPDGPLHLLPFAALVRARDAGVWQPLIERKPLHLTVSLAVYRELRRPRARDAPHPRATLSMVAFGDPVYPRSERAGSAPAATLLRGNALARLPYSRHEALTVADLYAPASRAFVGAAATEERAKLEFRRARLVHVAAHGLLDERFPLDSAIALSTHGKPTSEGADGFLQAWEVMEELRLDADLVTLSACESAAGPELGGDGLIGLTRAFHYAGAESVVASLWNVDDRSTAALMVRLYEGLRTGLPKDEALRQAQLALLHESVTLPRAPEATGFARLLAPFAPLLSGRPPEPERHDFSHPRHWAAFQLYGDWK